MKKLLSLIFACILALSLVNAFQGKIMPIYTEAGENTEFFVNVYNPKDKTMDDVRVTVYLPDFDIYEVSNTFDVRKKDSSRAVLFLDLPDDAKTGYYPVIVSVYGKNIRTTEHTWLSII